MCGAIERVSGSKYKDGARETGSDWRQQRQWGRQVKIGSRERVA